MSIDGEVVPGAQRGQRQGVPTANLRTANELLPPDAVYATTVSVDGVIHASVTNVGVRPTFETAGERVVETHLFDYAGRSVWDARQVGLRAAASGRAGVS